MRPYRQELKFLVHHEVKRVLLERWRPYLVKAPFTNEHAVTKVLSLYYDSPHLTFYQDKLAGIRRRQKVRVRTYGHEFKTGQTTILEIKHRRVELVRKLRQPLPDFTEAQLDPALWQFEDAATRSAFLGLLERHRLRPTAQVYYQREAYEGAVERDVRITFDTCLLGLHPGEKASRELMLGHSRCLMADTLAILEVKATNGIPGWVHQGIIAGELQQKTIPKYVTAVEALGLPELCDAGVYA